MDIQIKQLLHDVAEENDIEVVKMETDMDHVHLPINYSPAQSILQVVRLLKFRLTGFGDKVTMQIIWQSIFGENRHSGAMVILPVVLAM